MLKDKFSTSVKIAFFIILVIGLCLRFYQHLMPRSLWEDEAHLALNFIWFGYRDLMKPLENYQSAPIFFLFSIETVTRIFGYSEIALRSFPFVISIFCLPLFYKMVLTLTKNRLTALISFFVFALNISFIHYASEVKPYTLDVCAFIIMGYLALTEDAFVVKNRSLLLAIAGCLCPLYSNTSVVVLFCTALYMMSKWRLALRKSEVYTWELTTPKRDLLIFGSWGVVFAANFFTFIYKHPYGEGMRQIWQWTFVPTPVFTKEFADFMKMRIEDSIFTDLLFFTDKYYFGYILLALLLIGIGNIIYNRRYYILLFTVLPILLHFFMSMAYIYPFYFRFILYLLPPFIIIMAIGISAVAELLSRKLHYSLAGIFVAGCAYCCVIGSIEQFPFWDREIKPVLSVINKRYPDKKVLVTTPHTLYQYYMTTGYVKNKNMEPVPWQLKPEAYYSNEKVKANTSTYVLVYSANGWADGYGDVLRDLKAKNLIVSQFEYKTYGVAEIKPALVQ